MLSRNESSPMNQCSPTSNIYDGNLFVVMDQIRANRCSKKQVPTLSLVYQISTSNTRKMQIEDTKKRKNMGKN